MGLYFLAAMLLLMAFYAFSGTGGAAAVTYSQVQDLFQGEQVKSFYVQDGTDLYLNLQDGTVVRNELSSVELFREDLGELIAEQKERGILVDYDLAPVYTPPWWSEILLYVLLIGTVFLLWQYAMARAQGGGGVDQGRKFGRARIRFGSEGSKKVNFTDVAGAETGYQPSSQQHL